MKIHEYQAKELFESYGIPVQMQAVAESSREAKKLAEKIGYPAVVKAQVLVGGRGKAGGVKIAANKAEVEKVTDQILNLTIKDLPVEKVLIAPAVKIEQEYYMALTLDRNTKRLVLMISAAGGVDIEDLAVNRPEEILRFYINPTEDIIESDLRKELKSVFGSEDLVDQAEDTIRKMYQMFLDKDCSLVEINPFARINGTELIALDAKVNFDDNALFAHEDVEEMKNPEEWSQDEIEAKKHGLSFVSMDGDIGCIVNGAGLAMATMDIIKLYGGDPANFLDVGGSSNPQKVLNALKIITRNKKVKAILINIFGGITRCDDIANGILLALKEIDIEVPMVIRLIGTNDKEGRKILTDQGFEVHSDLSKAVETVVSAGKA